MLDAAGTTFEYQSSAFTETLKTQITTNQTNITSLTNKFSNTSSFGSDKGKITLSKNFEIMGQTSLVNGQTYTGSGPYNVGLAFRNTGLHNDLFDTTGRFIGVDMNFSISFEFGFLCKNSSIIIFKSYIQIANTAGANLDNSLTQGFHYNSGTTFNNILYFSIPPLKHIIKAGHQIFLNTSYAFTAGTQSPYLMDAKFTIERNPL